MKNRLRFNFAALALAALTVSGPVAAQMEAPSGPASETEGDIRFERFQDWTVRCEPVESAVDSCEMVQQVTVEETNETIMEVAVGFVPERALPIALLTVPLGIRIPPGLMLSVDGNEQVRIGIEICGQDGCFASMNFDEGLLAQFRAGTMGTIQVRDPRGQALDLPISLMGFTAALERIRP